MRRYRWQQLTVCIASDTPPLPLAKPPPPPTTIKLVRRAATTDHKTAERCRLQSCWRKPLDNATNQASFVIFVSDLWYNKLYNESIAYPPQIKCCLGSTASPQQVHNIWKNCTTKLIAKIHNKSNKWNFNLQVAAASCCACHGLIIILTKSIQLIVSNNK